MTETTGAETHLFVPAQVIFSHSLALTVDLKRATKVMTDSETILLNCEAKKTLVSLYHWKVTRLTQMILPFLVWRCFLFLVGVDVSVVLKGLLWRPIQPTSSDGHTAPYFPGYKSTPSKSFKPIFRITFCLYMRKLVPHGNTQSSYIHNKEVVFLIL